MNVATPERSVYRQVTANFEEGYKRMALSFLEGRKTATAPSKPVNRGDPLETAKQHIIQAIDGQKRLVRLLLEGETIPKQKGKRNVVWFYQDKDDQQYWTALRYGQFTIPLGEDGDTAVQVGKLSDLTEFYDQVIASIKKGELDQIISKLRAKRTGRRGRTDAATESAGAEAEAEPPAGEQSATEPPAGAKGRGKRGGRGSSATASVSSEPEPERESETMF